MDKTQEAEIQYNSMCRFVEQGYDDPSMQQSRDIFQSVVQEAPLYLFSREKSDRSLEYHKKNIPNLDSFIGIKPHIMCDSAGSVVILSVSSVDMPDGSRCHKADALMSQMSLSLPGEMASLSTGSIFIYSKNEGSEYDLSFHENFHSVFLGLDGKKVVSFHNVKQINNGSMINAAKRDFGTNVMTALEQLNYAHSPRKTIVSTKPSKPFVSGGSVMTPRSHQREIHYVLDPDEIREIKSQGGSHASPTPHKRRSHKRVLRHPKWGDKVGKVINVSECRVNVKPGEVIVTPRKVYHVVSTTEH